MMCVKRMGRFALIFLLFLLVLLPSVSAVSDSITAWNPQPTGSYSNYVNSGGAYFPNLSQIISAVPVVNTTVWTLTLQSNLGSGYQLQVGRGSSSSSFQYTGIAVDGSGNYAYASNTNGTGGLYWSGSGHTLNVWIVQPDTLHTAVSFESESGLDYEYYNISPFYIPFVSPTFSLVANPNSGLLTASYNLTLNRVASTGGWSYDTNLTYLCAAGQPFNTSSGNIADYANISNQWYQMDAVTGAYDLPVTNEYSPVVQFPSTFQNTGNVTVSCLVNEMEQPYGGVSFFSSAFINLQNSGAISVTVYAPDARTGLEAPNVTFEEYNIPSGGPFTPDFYCITSSQPYTFKVWGSHGQNLIQQGDWMAYNLSASGYQPNYDGVYITITQNQYSVVIPLVPNASAPSAALGQMAVITDCIDENSLAPVLGGQVTCTDQGILSSNTVTVNTSSFGTAYFPNLTAGDTFTFVATAPNYQPYTQSITYGTSNAGTTQALDLNMVQSGMSPNSWFQGINTNNSMVIGQNGVPMLSYGLPTAWLNIQPGNYTYPLQNVNTTVNQTIPIATNITGNLTWSSLPMLPVSLPALPINAGMVYYVAENMSSQTVPYMNFWNSAIGIPNAFVQLVILLVFLPLIIITAIYAFSIGLAVALILGAYDIVYVFFYTEGVLVSSMVPKVQAIITLGLTLNLIRLIYRWWQRYGVVH